MASEQQLAQVAVSYLADVAARPVVDSFDLPSVCYVKSLLPLQAAQRRLALAIAHYFGAASTAAAARVDTDVVAYIGSFVVARCLGISMAATTGCMSVRDSTLAYRSSGLLLQAATCTLAAHTAPTAVRSANTVCHQAAGHRRGGPSPLAASR